MDAKFNNPVNGSYDRDMLDLTLSEVPIDSPYKGSSLPPPDQLTKTSSNRAVPSNSSLSITIENGSSYDRDMLDLSLSELPIDSPDTGSSLPPPDQLTKTSSNRSVPSNGTARQRKWFCVTIAILLLAVVLGLSIGLTVSSPSTKSQNSEVKPAPRKATINDAAQYFISQGVSSRSDIHNADGPHAKAIAWLTESDEFNLPVPNHSILSPIGYHYVVRYVLAVIYFSLNGAEWFTTMNWLSGKSICDWNVVVTQVHSNGKHVSYLYGATCEARTQTLSRLDLDYLQLEGTVPKELGALTSLDTLFLNNNLLNGGLPEAVCNLLKLKLFSINKNELTGQLPSCMSNMTKLEYLILSENDFTGKIPDLSRMYGMKAFASDNNTRLEGNVTTFFSNMSELTLLYLDDTKLEGHIDRNFVKNSQKLMEIDLSTAQFHGNFPAHLLEEYPQLRILDLHGSKFRGTIPDTLSIPNTSSLVLLALHDNQLHGPIPESLSGLTRLSHLDLSYNMFNGSVPTFLSNLTDLERLYLSENSFDEGPIPEGFASLKNLTELSLKNTSRSGNIPSFLGNLTKLQLLDLDNNNFNETIPEELGNLLQLEILLLNRNEDVTGNVPTTFGQLNKLRKIFLDSTSLTGNLSVLCALSSPPYIAADCSDIDGGDTSSETEIQCSCCGTCCRDDASDECHDYNDVTNLAPNWQDNYNRIPGKYDFGG